MRALMRRVKEVGKPYDNITNYLNVIAFSGGVDSTVVAAAVHSVFPDNSVACIAKSPSLAKSQLERARDVANHVGIKLMEVSTYENLDPEYIANRGSSCYVCKTNLYETLRSVASYYAEDLDREIVLFNGTNADDRLDPTRLGLIAANEFNVYSPLDHAKKSQVREIARTMGLPNADLAASPCLRSRLALGVEATNLHLRFIDEAEDFVRNVLDLEPEHNMRVRLLPRNRIAIELDRDSIQKANTLERAFRCEFENYRDVEIREYKYGSVSGS
jgi:pyridinium-3,5-biscarboxylic acid mononucleotide sulfurtransferase